jgi:uncharacterized NAD(P)/FAD-binding protein YdhS
VTVIAPEHSGLGLAYSTDDPLHLLNVQVEKMGAWADDPEDLAVWLQTPAAVAAGRALGVELPARHEFAPRALFARYLTERRDTTVGSLGTPVRWLRTRAERIERAQDGWTITVGTTDSAGTATVSARTCVLCTGNDPRGVFGELAHPDLHDGPWDLDAEVANHTKPAALIGSGLTAVDSVLTLRRLGFRGEIVALSRNGRLPRPHRPEVSAPPLRPEQLDRIDSLDAVLALQRELRAAGHDWRGAIDALRPYTPELWQRLPQSDQQTAIDRWGAIWNVYRHRMAPPPAAQIAAELAGGGFRVVATRSITPIVDAGQLKLDYEPVEGPPARLAPSVVVDCTGPQLDCSRSSQTLLRGLVADGIATAHHTGLGLAADEHLQVAPHLYAVGGLLTGQRWETIAVPELREQAAAIAARIAATA